MRVTDQNESAFFKENHLFIPLFDIFKNILSSQDIFNDFVVYMLVYLLFLKVCKVPHKKHLNSTVYNFDLNFWKFWYHAL